MAQRGRPPKPIEVKRRTGNPGKRPLPESGNLVLLPAVNNIPEPNRPLLQFGRELWDRVWTMGHTWISYSTDIDLLLITCEQLDERVKLRTQVWNDGRPDERKALRQLEKQIVENLSLLGFTPTDRSRLGIAEVKKMSKLEELRAKQKENN
jgi:hypothetical protein